MSEVKARTGEVLDSVIRRWKRFVEKKGTLKELRKREFHKKDSTIRKLAADTAVKRWKKKLAKEEQLLSGARRTKKGGRGAGGRKSGGRGRAGSATAVNAANTEANASSGSGSAAASA